ncbi:Ku protein [Pelagibacterium flavum]|uniref:Non-homologous end joining protein Ku n=1 Tax=Pelagibacterium flavum TaxID=2984530 RepID=A0ABY6ITG3_9HYPH|nr:Ku protein [Pelagibacterium sp. YIM 151497]UYQ73885.1 Ku protein [Pelagibacterium sp. YIM 151497]|tara:strand:+ start:2457 stop:3314 length:858 start_codon:yes stop_codon:yes gene_type:complete
MPSARPVWKGQIRLSLVAIPVELYSASKTGARLSFRQIHGPSGKPVKYEKVVPGIGPVDSDEILKGFEYEKNDFVLLEDEEIDAVKLETRKTLELVQFVGGCEIDPIYFDKSYYVVPQDELAEDAFRVVRDALRSTERVGLGQIAMRGREYICALKPCGTGLLLETLHYEDEIRKSDPFFSGISKTRAEKDLLDVATQLIERKTAPFEAEKFKDHYTQALRALVDKKLKSKGRKKIAADTEEPTAAESKGNVIDLMDALKSSLEGTGGRKKPAAKSAKSTRKKAS